MISPTSLVERLGVSGRLVLFFKCVCVYFAVGGSSPSLAGVAAKCAPILCLLAFVLLHHSTLTYNQGWYSRRIAAGLALSALGDALLVWPQHFVAGMAAFAAAHLAYLAAFRFTPLRLTLGLACYAVTGYYLTLIEPPEGLKVLVPLYGALLTTMAWRGVARSGGARDGAALDGALRDGVKQDGAAQEGPTRDGAIRSAGAAGAALFLISDAILGYSLFGGPVPYKQVLVMTTYYVGQLGIAVSALETPL